MRSLSGTRSWGRGLMIEVGSVKGFVVVRKGSGN